VILIVVGAKALTTKRDNVMWPIKVTLLGAGSTFTPRLVTDLLLTPGAERVELALVDVDAHRLEAMRQLVERLKAHHNRPKWTIHAATDRTEVLAHSDYLICCIEVAGLACVDLDYDIPARYGIDQCIGDTTGPGGVFKALRTGPAMLAILRDAERLCPEALLLNHTNPMNILCLLAQRESAIATVGLCHSVPATSQKLAHEAGVDADQMHWQCAGINHLAWFTELSHQGHDLYPALKAKFARDVEAGIAESLHREGDYQYWDLVRKDMCCQFGAFITESSGHLSEYVPYYRKSEAGRLLLRPGYDGESRFYANEWPKWRAQQDAQRDAMARGEVALPHQRSDEYTTAIIEAIEKDSPVTIHGNVANTLPTGHGRLIKNLPNDGCVEVACQVDRQGVQPRRFGALPSQMAGLCEANMRTFDLTATAIAERSKEAAIHALMLDPLTAAMLTPGQIRDMTGELFEAEADYLPGYR
jgi:alpha-galactosidase